MKNILAEANKKIRGSKPYIDASQLYAIWLENNNLQIFLCGKGCRFAQLGMCTMCDYGIAEKNLTLHETAVAMNYVLKNLTPQIDSVCLGALGSFFDTYEISNECRRYILRTIARLDIKKVTIESFYTTVTGKILEETTDILKGKTIAIEMGLETADEYVQKNCYNKIIPLPLLREKMDLVHEKGCAVGLNILFGAPFLDLEDQITDSLNSVLWAFSNGADWIELFPVNIKPYTLLKELYLGGFYEPVSQWGFLMLLDEIPEQYLGRVSLSWFGNRESNYREEDFAHVFPRSCPDCREQILHFYGDFLKTSDCSERKNMLQDMFRREFSCDCREKEIEKRKKRKNMKAVEKSALEYLNAKFLSEP